MKDVITFMPNAYEELASCFKKSSGNAYIRIYIQPYTCVGPTARMMRDFKGPTDKDAVFPFEHFTIIISKNLLEKMEQITFEFNGYTPLIHSNMKNVSPGCPHCPYGQEGNCIVTRKNPKNYATWKVAKAAARTA